MKDNCNDVGVVPDVHQFISGVAIIGVHRSETRLESRKQTFQVLRAVVHVLRDFVLLLDAGIQQTLGDSVGAAVEIGP